MKRLKKRTISLGKGAIGLSIGSQVLGTMNGGAITAKGQAGMGAMAGFFPVVGTTLGAGMVMGSLKMLGKTVKKRK